MGRTLFGLAMATVFWIVLLSPQPFPASGRLIGASTAWAEEEFRYHDEEILFHFSQDKNLVHFNHLCGMLTDLWREHNKIFDAKGKGENTVAPKVEDLINDANLAASQGNYEEGFAALKTAFELLRTSLAELGVKAEH